MLKKCCHPSKCSRNPLIAPQTKSRTQMSIKANSDHNRTRKVKSILRFRTWNRARILANSSTNNSKWQILQMFQLQTIYSQTSRRPRMISRACLISTTHEWMIVRWQSRDFRSWPKLCNLRGMPTLVKCLFEVRVHLKEKMKAICNIWKMDLRPIKFYLTTFEHNSEEITKPPGLIKWAKITKLATLTLSVWVLKQTRVLFLQKLTSLWSNETRQVEVPWKKLTDRSLLSAQMIREMESSCTVIEMQKIKDPNRTGQSPHADQDSQLWQKIRKRMIMCEIIEPRESIKLKWQDSKTSINMGGVKMWRKIELPELS